MENQKHQQQFKFNVGDKVVRFRDVNERFLSKAVNGLPVTVVGVEESFDGWGDRLSFSAEDGGSGWLSYYYKPYEEKQMFDMKKQPWYVTVTSQKEFDAVQEWLLTNYGSNFNAEYYNGGIVSLSNFDFTGKILDKIVWWSAEPVKFNCEIKLNFKTTVDSVEYPEIMDEKQIEIEKIRKEMENLTERMKKLENS